VSCGPTRHQIPETPHVVSYMIGCKLVKLGVEPRLSLVLRACRCKFLTTSANSIVR
jgi:hypothetical protein